MNKLIVLTGPTAVGKTDLSINLAKSINGEIISGDSMQVYKHMDIGTAKVTREEMDGVPHHLIDFLDPKENYNAFTFKEMGEACLKDIYQRNKLPIICGGTGFYIQSLCYDIDFSTGCDYEYRERLTELLEKLGEDFLFEMLKDCDPDYAEIIPKENHKRVIRALEFFKTTGEPISKHNDKERSKNSPYDLKYFVLTKSRESLYADINKRVDIMIDEGLLEEAEFIYKLGLPPDSTALKAIGYHELFPYFKGECTLEYAINKIKQDTRHFAKRQITWFKREKDVIWVDKDKFEDKNKILEFLLERINE